MKLYISTLIKMPCKWTESLLLGYVWTQWTSYKGGSWAGSCIHSELELHPHNYVFVVNPCSTLDIAVSSICLIQYDHVVAKCHMLLHHCTMQLIRIPEEKHPLLPHMPSEEYCWQNCYAKPKWWKISFGGPVISPNFLLCYRWTRVIIPTSARGLCCFSVKILGHLLKQSLTDTVKGEQSQDLPENVGVNNIVGCIIRNVGSSIFRGWPILGVKSQDIAACCFIILAICFPNFMKM